MKIKNFFTIKDLLDMVEEKDVSRALGYHYPEIKGENMMKAFRKLKKMSVSKPDKS